MLIKVLVYCYSNNVLHNWIPCSGVVQLAVLAVYPQQLPQPLHLHGLQPRARPHARRRSLLLLLPLLQRPHQDGQEAARAL